MRAAKTLMEDNRGAIVVMGAFMATFLVGCLWYLIGVGDALVYRERMQDAADAVAYTGAVYHARGMNLIAMMNVLMAALLAVLVALTIVQLVSTAVAFAASILCSIANGEWACNIAKAAAEDWAHVTNFLPTARERVERLLAVCSQAQTAIARTAPLVAAQRSAAVAASYGPTVISGSAVSLSMVPLGDRLGLPVEEAFFDQLCEKASQALGPSVFGVEGMIPGVGVFVPGLVHHLAGALPQYFCGGGGDLMLPGFGQNAEKSCQASAQHNAGNPLFDFNACVSSVQSAQKQVVDANNAAHGILNIQLWKNNVDPISPVGRTHKRMTGNARNGDDHFQVYSFVTGNFGGTKRSDKAVELPAWKKASVDAGSYFTDDFQSLGLAEAEFYYDAEGEWSDYADDVMWNMRWRARLRRFRLPKTGAAADVMNAVFAPHYGVTMAKLEVGEMSKALHDALRAAQASPPSDFDSRVNAFVGASDEDKIIH